MAMGAGIDVVLQSRWADLHNGHHPNATFYPSLHVHHSMAISGLTFLGRPTLFILRISYHGRRMSNIGIFCGLVEGHHLHIQIRRSNCARNLGVLPTLRNSTLILNSLRGREDGQIQMQGRRSRRGPRELSRRCASWTSQSTRDFWANPAKLPR